MNEDEKNKYLNIEIPDKLKDQISMFKVTSEFDLIIGVNGKTVIGSVEFKKINKLEVLDWKKTIEKIMIKLKETGIQHEILTSIHLLLINNSSKFKEFVEPINNQIKEKKYDETKDKPKIKICKYYSFKEHKLYETVVLAGIPCLIAYDNHADDFIVVDKIEEDTRFLIPYDIEDSPAMPYTFENKDQLVATLKKSKSLTISHLFKETRHIISKYIDQKPNILNIIAADMIFSYFQDRFPTTHYLLFVGKNDVGKSAIGDVFEQISYRGVMMTDPSVANIYRLLGKIEPAQFTIILDEANDIDNNNDKMNVLKTGYTINGKVPKINTSIDNTQEFFKTYSFKVFLAETIPSTYKARGLLDRTFVITCLPGNPQLSIKDILVNSGNMGNYYFKLRDEIKDLRQLLFMYRLIHSYDEKIDVDIGLKNRDKELCELISIFYGSDVQQEVEGSFQELLDAKYEQKENSFDAKLIFLILENLKNSTTFGEIFVEDLWTSIKNTMNCEVVSTNEMFLVDFNHTLYRNQLSNRCQMYGGKSKHTNNGNKIIFKDIDKLQEIFDSYCTTNRPMIRCSIRNAEIEGSEGCEGSEGSGQRHDEIITNHRKNKTMTKDPSLGD